MKRRLGEDDVNLEDNKGVPDYGLSCAIEVGGSSPDRTSQGTATASAQEGAIDFGKMRARDQERFSHRRFEPGYIDELEKK